MSNARERQVEICVYGATASGMMAAVAASRCGRSVLVVEPSRWLGGMIGGGIRITTDCEYPNHVGGLTRELLLKERMFDVWDRDSGQLELRRMWRQLAEEHHIPIVREHRLQDVSKSGHRIERLTFEYAPPERDGVPDSESTSRDALTVQAQVFIDASYEGDVIAKAGVSYIVGREGRDEYGESLAGVRHVQRFPHVDPYQTLGDPNSGLLPLIPSEPLGEIGDASRFFIPINFRCVRSILRANGGSAADPPKHVESHHAELVKRVHSAGFLGRRGANFDRASPLTGSIPGLHVDYPDGDWATRARIWRTLINHDRLTFQLTGQKLGLAVHMYPDTDGWPHQLYIRMARRMRGRYLVTQADLALQTEVSDPIGLGYYNVDIYPCRLVVLDDGTLATEGETWELVSPGPYPISYRALTPTPDQCTNLLASVCISASHVACASIRMEPTFMIIGESAGHAAAQAVEEQTTVQEIDDDRLQSSLRDAGQILKWDGKGYGPYWWNRRFESWWEKHPEEYHANPYI